MTLQPCYAPNCNAMDGNAYRLEVLGEELDIVLCKRHARNLKTKIGKTQYVKSGVVRIRLQMLDPSGRPEP